MDLSSASAADQKQMEDALLDIRMQDIMRQLNNTVERCFDHCSTSFRSKNLDANEKKCMTSCADKYFKYTTRTGLRFQEEQAELQLQQQQQQQKHQL
jgi:import inner membrane translocase subunit TIM9